MQTFCIYIFSEMNSEAICTTNWSLHLFSFASVYEIGTGYVKPQLMG